MKYVIKDYIYAAWYLFTFQSSTVYPRWMEITYGIIAWIAVVVIVFALFKMPDHSIRIIH